MIVYDVLWPPIVRCSSRRSIKQRRVNFATPETILRVIFQYRNSTGSLYCFPGQRYYRVPRLAREC